MLGCIFTFYDRTKDTVFYEHGDNVRKFKGKTSLTSDAILGKGIFLPQNKKELQVDQEYPINGF